MTARWRVAIVFEIDAETDEEAWEHTDTIVSNMDADMYDPTMLEIVTGSGPMRERLGQVEREAP